MEKIAVKLQKILDSVEDSKKALKEKDLKPPTNMKFTDIDEEIEKYDLEYVK